MKWSSGWSWERHIRSSIRSRLVWQCEAAMKSSLALIKSPHLCWNWAATRASMPPSSHVPRDPFCHYIICDLWDEQLFQNYHMCSIFARKKDFPEITMDIWHIFQVVSTLVRMLQLVLPLISINFLCFQLASLICFLHALDKLNSLFASLLVYAYSLSSTICMHTLRGILVYVMWESSFMINWTSHLKDHKRIIFPYATNVFLFGVSFRRQRIWRQKQAQQK